MSRQRLLFRTVAGVTRVLPPAAVRQVFSMVGLHPDGSSRCRPEPQPQVLP